MISKLGPIERCTFSQVCFRVAYRLIERDYLANKDSYRSNRYDALGRLADSLAGFSSVSGAIRTYSHYSMRGDNLADIRDFICRFKRAPSKLSSGHGWGKALQYQMDIENYDD